MFNFFKCIPNVYFSCNPAENAQYVLGWLRRDWWVFSPANTGSPKKPEEFLILIAAGFYFLNPNVRWEPLLTAPDSHLLCICSYGGAPALGLTEVMKGEPEGLWPQSFSQKARWCGPVILMWREKCVCEAEHSG